MEKLPFFLPAGGLWINRVSSPQGVWIKKPGIPWFFRVIHSIHAPTITTNIILSVYTVLFINLNEEGRVYEIYL